MAIPGISIALRKGKLFVIPTYSPGPGTYIDKGPVANSASYDTLVIGKNVIAGLEDFVDGGDLPDFTEYCSPVLEAAGVASWSEYERGLRECVLARHADHYLIRGDFGHIKLTLDASREEIGEAILASLGTSQEKEQKKTQRRGQ